MNSPKNYQGVILAAGHGSRMGPFGDELPKPIAPICNKPLLAYQLEAMRSLGIRDVTIVIGHLGHRITQTLGNGAEYGLNIHYVEQEKRLGLAHAVGQLEPHLDRPFLLMLGDIFFDVTNFHQLITEFEQTSAAAVLAVKNEPDPQAIKRNFAIILHEDGSVRRVIEKPRHVPNNLKGCGIYLFDERIFEAVRRTPRTAMRDEYELTDSIQILIDYEYPVRAVNVVQWDINLTYIADLIRCCRHQLKKLELPSLTGHACNLAQGVELHETVLGDHVTITKPLRLERCVVLPNVTISDGLNRAGAVITPQGILQSEQTPDTP